MGVLMAVEHWWDSCKVAFQLHSTLRSPHSIIYTVGKRDFIVEATW